jgi:hypothetical protein
MVPKLPVMSPCDLPHGRQRIWIVDAHRSGKRFIVRSYEKLTALEELERAIREFAVSLVS